MPNTDNFEKNLTRWETFYPKDAKKIKTLCCKDVDFHPNPNGELNLKTTVNNQVTFFHSTTNALEEAQRQFAALDLNNISILIVFGVGLGYFYDAAKEWLHENKAHGLVFVEDNLEVIHRLLETERGTEILHDQQVWLAYLDPNMANLDSLAQVFVVRHYLLIASPHYDQIKKQILASVQSRFAFFMNLRAGMTFEYEDYGRQFFKNFFKNIFELPKSYYGNGLFQQFKGIPAIICGAGPSLGKNIHVLEQLRDRALIFAGGTAMNALNAVGLLPHFGVGIDPNKAQFTRLIMNQAYEIPFLYRNRFRNEALKIIHGDHLYITGTMGYNISDWFENKMGIKGENVEEGCNVINFSVALAHAMGCNPIILVGVDLAYTDGQSYAQGILNHPLHDRREYFKTKTSEEELLSKIDIFGMPTLTLWKWISESVWFTTFARKHPEKILVNSTEGGIGFADIPNLSLADVAEKLLPNQYDFQGLVSAEIQTNPLPATVTEEAIKAATEEILSSLKRCYDYCETVREDFQESERKLNEDLPIPENILSEKSIDALGKLEQEPAYIHILKVFSDHFIQLFTREFQRLSYDESLLTERDMTIKRVRLNSSRYKFLKETAQTSMRTIEQVLEEIAERKKLSAMRQKTHAAVTPPQSEPSPHERYAFEGGKLTIKDSELGIAFEESFVPDEIGGVKRVQYPSGALKSEQYYLDNALHGPSSYYDSNGQLLARYWFVRGVRQGKGRTYYVDGALRSVEKYKDGMWEGEQTYYYPDGTLKLRLPYSQGQLDGEVLLYHSNGQQERQLHFVKGKRQGFERIWNEMGLMTIEVEFDQDLPVGKARKWYPNGNIAFEAIYEPGTNQSQIREWDDSGRPLEQKRGDYYDQVTYQTGQLTTSLGHVFKQVESLAPLVEQMLPSDAKATVHVDIQKGMKEIAEHLAKLDEINKKLFYETGLDVANPNEAIWKSPSHRREIEKQVQLMTKEMTSGMNDIQAALVKTLGLLSNKIDKMNEQRKKSEAKDTPKIPPEEKPHESK